MKEHDIDCLLVQPGHSDYRICTCEPLRCHECHAEVSDDDAVWVNPKTREATTGDNGEPFHIECAPSSMPLVKVTSHVKPPLVVRYTLAEFLQANAQDMDEEQIQALLDGDEIRMGGGAAPIVDVRPIGRES